MLVWAYITTADWKSYHFSFILFHPRSCRNPSRQILPKYVCNLVGFLN